MPRDDSKLVFVFFTVAGVVFWDGFLVVLLLAVSSVEPKLGYASLSVWPLVALMTLIGGIWGFLHGIDVYVKT